MTQTFASEWLRDALCVRRKVDPRIFDSTDSRLSVDNIMLAHSLCFACPVLSECAAYAIEIKPVSTIIAGVPVPARPCWGPARESAAVRALHRIAEGEQLARVLLDELCASPPLGRAREALERAASGGPVWVGGRDE